MAKAVFLDRDETLNPDSGYIHDHRLFDLFPWVPTELKKLKEAGFLLIVVSNQSGIGRGLITWPELLEIHEKLDSILSKTVQIKIDDYEICPHRPDELCDCRKPKPKLILDAIQKFSIRPEESFLIGDRVSDFEAGESASLKKSFLIPSGDEQAFKSAVAEILKNEAP